MCCHHHRQGLALCTTWQRRQEAPLRNIMQGSPYTHRGKKISQFLQIGVCREADACMQPGAQPKMHACCFCRCQSSMQAPLLQGAWQCSNIIKTLIVPVMLACCAQASHVAAHKCISLQDKYSILTGQHSNLDQPEISQDGSLCSDLQATSIAGLPCTCAHSNMYPC